MAIKEARPAQLTSELPTPEPAMLTPKLPTPELPMPAEPPVQHSAVEGVSFPEAKTEGVPVLAPASVSLPLSSVVSGPVPVSASNMLDTMLDTLHQLLTQEGLLSLLQT